MNSFLDRTPRQWIGHLNQIIPQKMHYFLSIIIHSLLLFVAPQESILNLNLKSKTSVQTITEIAVISSGNNVKNIEIKNGSEDFLISKKNQNKKKTEDEKLKALLKNLKSQKQLSWTRNNQKSAFDKTIAQKINVESSMSMGQVLVAIQENPKNKEEFKKEDQSLLLKMIENHQSVFRKCYETSKLQDQNISGQVTVGLYYNGLQNVSEVQFQGQGTPESRRQLKTCLEQETLRIPIKNVKSDVKIKFGLVFI